MLSLLWMMVLCPITYSCPKNRHRLHGVGDLYRNGSTGTSAPAHQPPSSGAKPCPQISQSPEEGTTLTSTVFFTVPDTSSPSPTYHPAVAGLGYSGRSKDDKSRALKNVSIVVSIPGGMTNKMCNVYIVLQSPSVQTGWY
ncbi:hypothetical protein QBC43DRAFT_321745 [Cladorrhinum sp. PSN259]|nr:hypothetical protein QBC43DRAFT_321745 [Cladorrhinum sp. PSN259]